MEFIISYASSMALLPSLKNPLGQLMEKYYRALIPTSINRIL